MGIINSYIFFKTNRVSLTKIYLVVILDQIRNTSISYNLAALAKEEREKLNLDLVAASVAFKERYNMPVIADKVEAEQAPHLREHFRKQLTLFRKISHTLDRLPYVPRKG